MNAETILSILWTVTWQSAAIIVVIVAFRAVLGRRIPARLRYALWSIVGLRLLLPALPTSPVGLFPENQSFATSLDKLGVVDLPKEEVLSTIVSVDAITVAAPFSLYWPWMLVGLWLIGVAASFLVLCRRRRRMRLWLASRDQHLEHNWDEEIEQACLDLGLRSIPDVCLVSGRSSPALFGFLRPVLILPRGIMTRLSASERMAVLRHEASHLAGKDHWFEALRSVLLCLHWFNPFLWMANRFMIADREQACDERVLAATREEPLVYGEALLAVLRLGIESRAPASGLGVLDSSLRQRILGIQAYRSAGPWRKLSATGLLVLLVVFGLTRADDDPVKPKAGQEIGYVVESYSSMPPEPPENIPELKVVASRMAHEEGTGIVTYTGGVVLDQPIRIEGWAGSYDEEKGILVINGQPGGPQAKVRRDDETFKADTIRYYPQTARLECEGNVTIPKNDQPILRRLPNLADQPDRPEDKIMRGINIKRLLFDDTPITDAVDFLNVEAKKKGLTLAVSPAVRKLMPRISLSVDDVSLRTSMRMLTTMTDSVLTYPEEGVVMIEVENDVGIE